ncbi:MAG: YHS domain-containing protein [Candidatus Aminicenantales bacterium]
MLQGIIKIAFYVLIAYIVLIIYRFFKSLLRARNPQGTAGHDSRLMVKDEYCNTYLPREEALREVIDGKEYFFCSPECRHKFLEKLGT